MKAENQISVQVTAKKKKKRLKASFKIKLPAGIFYENKQKMFQFFTKSTIYLHYRYKPPCRHPLL